MDALAQNKRAIVAPATYRTTKVARRGSMLTRTGGKRLKFSEVNTEITFDVGSAPQLIREPAEPTDADLQQYVKCLITAGSGNIKLKLELLGSRVSDLAELDNLLSQPELGFQTLCQPEDIARIPNMTRAEMMEALSCVANFLPYDTLEDDDLRQMLKRLYEADLRRANQRRKEIIDNELALRSILPTANLIDNVRLLRKELKREAEIAKQEDAIINEILDSVQNLTRDECIEKLRELRQTTTSNILQAVGLSTTGSIQELEKRLDLFFEIRKRTLILSSRIQPDELNRDELVAALEERRIQIPFGANDQFLKRILANALVGELEKAPIKFPFGVRTLTLEDLDDLPSVVVRTMLLHSRGRAAVEDIPLNDDELLQERLRTTILQQNNSAYVKVIRNLLRDMKCFDVIGDLDDKENMDWTEWFEQLEQCMNRSNQ